MTTPPQRLLIVQKDSSIKEPARDPCRRPLTRNRPEPSDPHVALAHQGPARHHRRRCRPVLDAGRKERGARVRRVREGRRATRATAALKRECHRTCLPPSCPRDRRRPHHPPAGPTCRTPPPARAPGPRPPAPAPGTACRRRASPRPAITETGAELVARSPPLPPRLQRSASPPASEARTIPPGEKRGGSRRGSAAGSRRS